MKNQNKHFAQCTPLAYLSSLAAATKRELAHSGSVLFCSVQFAIGSANVPLPPLWMFALWPCVCGCVCWRDAYADKALEKESILKVLARYPRSCCVIVAFAVDDDILTRERYHHHQHHPEHYWQSIMASIKYHHYSPSIRNYWLSFDTYGRSIRVTA